MRHLLCVPRAPLRAAAASAAVAAKTYTATTTYTAASITCAVRWQTNSPRAGGRNFGGSSSSSSSRGGGGFGQTTSTSADPLRLMNKTNDGELSFGTRVAMRDDSIILTEIFTHIPSQGAISIKSLFSALTPDVQEALSERHGGLRSFVEQRKQIFTVRPHPSDGVLYVVGNPLVAQQYATRQSQLKTMRQMMGLKEDGSVPSSAPQSSQQQQRSGRNFAPRGRIGDGGRGGGGGGGGSYHRGNGGDDRRYRRGSSSSSSGNDGMGGRDDAYSGRGRGGSGDRRPPQFREDRRGFGGGNRYGNDGRNGPPPPQRRSLKSQPQSFGTRNEG